MTEAQLINLIAQGGGVVAFIWLFIDTRRESKQREERLMAALEKLSKAYDELAFVRKINE